MARRPGAAALSGVLTAALVTPHYAGAGGGSDVSRYYRWVVSDALGSGTAEFDAAGRLVHQVRYTPFGAVEAEYAPGSLDGDDVDERAFYAGHPRQPETGLVYMRARWMDPTTGTFLSVDPVVRDYANPHPLKKAGSKGRTKSAQNSVRREPPTGGRECSVSLSTS